MILRNALQTDAAQLVALVAQMGSDYKMSLENMQARITAFNNKNHKIVVAEEEGALIGVIAFACYEQLRIPGSCCHIDTLVINNNHRGKGIGKQLMAEAEKYATEHGAIVIELITANHRRKSGTHAFYESLGYKDHSILDYSYFSKDKPKSLENFSNTETSEKSSIRSRL